MIDTYREPGNGALPNLEATLPASWDLYFQTEKMLLCVFELVFLVKIIRIGFLEIQWYLKTELDEFNDLKGLMRIRWILRCNEHQFLGRMHTSLYKRTLMDTCRVILRTSTLSS